VEWSWICVDHCFREPHLRRNWGAGLKRPTTHPRGGVAHLLTVHIESLDTQNKPAQTNAKNINAVGNEETRFETSLSLYLGDATLLPIPNL